MILSVVLGRLVLVATTTALARTRSPNEFDAAQGWLISDDSLNHPFDEELISSMAAASPFDNYENNKSRWVFSPR
jgi:hypothetical protein